MPKRSADTSSSNKLCQEDLAAIFGANFRHTRVKANLTQADVAVRAGIRQQHISEIENGVRNLTLSTMIALSSAIGADVRTLLKRRSR